MSPEEWMNVEDVPKKETSDIEFICKPSILGEVNIFKPLQIQLQTFNFGGANILKYIYKP